MVYWIYSELSINFVNPFYFFDNRLISKIIENMRISLIGSELVFPPVKNAVDGILAVGGDLTPKRLLLAYESGIFPWFSADEPIIWWAPNPRFVLFPEQLKISKSMKSVFRKQEFTVTFDQDFKKVIQNCQKITRKGQDDTWITKDMLNAYYELHLQGFAHSVEVWKNEKLVGGLYGVSIGKCFFGESMFSTESNASKVGFITLVEKLKHFDFQLIDCQVYTEHLESLGAIEIPRKKFMDLLKIGTKFDTLTGNWSQYLTDIESLT